MAKALLALILMLFLAGFLSASVVINELMYDPVGTDTGNEWIELYNNGSTDIDLEGAHIQVAGSSFTTVFTFPHYVLRSHRFVLIGEANITQAAFITPLVMQNGGDATDGVRFLSADGNYTDTALYDSPNSNSLPDDTGNPGTAFALDVSAGYSLARKADGLDTDDCEADFIAEAEPTPGLPNRNICDYALVNNALYQEENAYFFNTYIYNYSPADCDTLMITLELWFNNQLIQFFDIQPVEAGSFIPFSTPLSLPIQAVGLFRAELVLYNDADSLNNTWSEQVGNPELMTICINEIMYNPETDNQEWIELHIPPAACGSYDVEIVDAADNSVTVPLTYLCAQYMVVCRNTALLQSRYPECPAANIIEVNYLPALNNDGDSILLKNMDGTVIDSISYIGVSNKKDISLERQVDADSTISWHYCTDLSGGTPGQPNSIPPAPPPVEEGHVRLEGSPFNPLLNESVKLQYNFNDDTNTLTCQVYDLKGIKRFTLASGLQIGSSGELAWDGKDSHGKALPRGIYILLVEVKDSAGDYFLRKQLAVVLATK